MSKIIMREARYSDLPHIEKLIIAGIKESEVRYPMPEYPALYMRLSDSISRGFAQVTIQDGALTGLAVLGVASWPWAPASNFFSDEYFLVGKEYRASSAGVQLLSWMKEVAEQAGIALFLMNSNGVDVDRKDEFIQRNGGERIGGVFVIYPPMLTEH